MLTYSSITVKGILAIALASSSQSLLFESKRGSVKMNSNFASQSKSKLMLLKQFHQEPQVNIKELWNYCLMAPPRLRHLVARIAKLGSHKVVSVTALVTISKHYYWIISL